MRKRAVILTATGIFLVAAVILLTALFVKDKAPSDDEFPVRDRTACIDGNWELTGEWTVNRAVSGAETLRVAAKEDSTAWNTFFRLYQDWTVSADMELLKEHGASDCMRLAFGDTYNNVCLVVSVEFAGKTSVLLRADTLTPNGWKNIFTGKNWLTIADAPLHIEVSRKSGGDMLGVRLLQNDTLYADGVTKRFGKTSADMLERPALSAYGTEGEFTNFSVVAARKPSAPATDKDVIHAEENVPTEDWILGKNAVHNLKNGSSVLILDGDGENHAWNVPNKLENTWTMSFAINFGKGYRDSVCSRIMFGEKAQDDGDYCGLVTVSYANGSVSLQAENKEDGAWVTTASSMGWKPVSSRSVQLEIAKYPEINRLALSLKEGEQLIFSEFTDEISQSDMEKYRHYGVMVYSSQVRFGKFSFAEEADETKRPAIIERDCPEIDKLQLGKPEQTTDWVLCKDALFFREDGTTSLVQDSKGEIFSYYTAHTINGEWSASAKVEFGRYYSETAGVRVKFTDENQHIISLLTVKYSPPENTIEVALQTYNEPNDEWTTVAGSGWVKGEKSFRLYFGGDGKEIFCVAVKSLTNGKVLWETEIKLPAELYRQMRVIGFGTLCAQSKFSEIKLSLDGAEVSLK